MQKRAIYPGTFDPITLGHVDIIERSSRVFDEVLVTLAVNPKKTALFSAAERREMLEDAVKHISNVKVLEFDGLIVDLAKSEGASAIIRGLRAISDFEFEFQMALMNRNLAEEIDTVFFMPDEKFTYISSSIIKNVASFKGEIRKLVPKLVAEKLINRYDKEDVQ